MAGDEDHEHVKEPHKEHGHANEKYDETKESSFSFYGMIENSLRNID